MTTEKIIRYSLSFLESEYHLEFEFIQNRGDHYLYKNKFGRFEFYEWRQFQEASFFVYANEECKTIDMLIEQPKEIGEFQQKQRGLKRVFVDNRKEYWDIIASIIKNEISKNGDLFGLKLI